MLINCTADLFAFLHVTVNGRVCSTCVPSSQVNQYLERVGQLFIEVEVASGGYLLSC